MSKKQPLTGACACGAITYSIAPPHKVADEEPFYAFTYCHCVTCRRASGSAFLPFIHLKESRCVSCPSLYSLCSYCTKWNPYFYVSSSSYLDSAKYTDDTNSVTFSGNPRRIFEATPHAQRFFCDKCGGQLGMRYHKRQYSAEKGTIHLTVGSLDEESYRFVSPLMAKSDQAAAQAGGKNGAGDVKEENDGEEGRVALVPVQHIFIEEHPKWFELERYHDGVEMRMVKMPGWTDEGPIGDE
jgi:hypothetical protein